MLTIMEYDLTEGTFPKADDQVILTNSSREALGVRLGDSVTLITPDGGSRDYTISGFGMDNEVATKADAVIAFLPLSGFQSLHHLVHQTAEDADMVYYVQFSQHCTSERPSGMFRSSLVLRRIRSAGTPPYSVSWVLVMIPFMTGLYLVAGHPVSFWFSQPVSLWLPAA